MCSARAEYTKKNFVVAGIILKTHNFFQIVPAVKRHFSFLRFYSWNSDFSAKFSQKNVFRALNSRKKHVEGFFSQKTRTNS